MSKWLLLRGEEFGGYPYISAALGFQGQVESKWGFAPRIPAVLIASPTPLLLQRQADGPGGHVVPIDGNLVHGPCRGEETDLAGHGGAVIVIVGHQ